MKLTTEEQKRRREERERMRREFEAEEREDAGGRGGFPAVGMPPAENGRQRAYEGSSVGSLQGSTLVCLGPVVQRRESFMDILRRIGNQHPPEGQHLPDESTDFMNMRKLQQRDRLTEKLLSGQASQAEYGRGIASLIQGLVDLLPKRDGIWPLKERAKWLRLAADIFDLGYKAGNGEHTEISIAVVKQEAAGPRRS